MYLKYSPFLNSLPLLLFTGNGRELSNGLYMAVNKQNKIYNLLSLEPVLRLEVTIQKNYFNKKVL